MGETNERDGAEGGTELPAREQAALSALVAAELGRGKPTAEIEETGGEAGETGTEEAEGTKTAEGESGGEGTEAEPGQQTEDGESAEDEAPETETEEDAEDRLPKTLQAKIDRRIGKLVRRAREAEERAEGLAGRLAELEKQAGQRESRATGPNQVGEARTIKELEQAVDNAWKIKRWCEEHPEGGNLGEQEITPEQVRAARANAEETIHRVAPRRREELTRFGAEEAQWNQAAEKRFPALKDPESELSRLAAEAVGLLPALKGIPSWRFAAAVYARGAMELAKEDAAAKAKPAKPLKAPAKQPLNARGGTTVMEAGEAKRTAALKRAKVGGTQEDLAEYFRTARM